MKLFKLANGPWEKLFEGKFQKHDLVLYSNPEKILMMLILEKKLDKIEGAIVELYKVFHGIGDVESFTEALPRDVLIVIKHDEKQTIKFLMLGSKPTYVNWNETDFTKEVDSLVKKLETSSSMIKDVSKAYELTLQEISESNPDVQTAFFTQPMLVPLMATSSHNLGAAAAGDGLKALTQGDIVIGLTRDKKKIIEPLALFKSVIVSEGTDKDRIRILQVLGESALLSNTPVLFIDKDKSFAGIGEASKEDAELDKYQVEIDPLGFPIKNYKPTNNVKVDLNLISPEGVAEIFGVGDKDFPRILKLVLSQGEVTTIDELADKISEMEQTEEFSEFQIQKTSRILKLMNIIYPGLFGGSNEMSSIMKKGASNIDRASAIDFSLLDDRGSVLLVHSLVKGALKESAKGGRVMAIIPQAEFLQAKGKQHKISKEIYSTLNELTAKGSLFALATKKVIDIDPETRKNAMVKINVVSGNDAGIQLKEKKSYRVLIRPTLSKRA